MKTITRELAHVGMFGPDGVTITKAHLADCAETFDGKCPATLGHRLADFLPKFGNVQSVELAENGDSLIGKVELHDLLADAIDEKFYEDISVGIQKRKSDGKHYLHHLAFLGAVPPKIRDLKVFGDLGVLMFGDEEDVAMFADVQPSQAGGDAPDEVAKALQRIAERGRSAWPLQDALTALSELTAYASEMLLSGAAIPAALKDQMQSFADQIQSGEAGKAGEPGDKEGDVELQQENDQLKKELADLTASAVAQAKDGIRQAMEGRVPKAKQGLVLELADHLDAKAEIELADGEGAKERVSSLEVLRRVIESIPKPVVEGRAELGDGTEPKPLDLSAIKGKF